MTELPSDPPESESPQRPRRGRPPNGTREAMRDPIRENEWKGRDGEVLTRKASALSDPYDIPPNLKEPGWDYQWNTVSVVNDTEVVVHHDATMHANGWRPVNADRPGFKERFGTYGKTGAIIIKGLRLDERPLSMSEQARREDLRLAKQQMEDRDSALTGRKADLRQMLRNEGLGLVQGYPKRGAPNAMRINIAPDNEAPAPSYSYDVE